MTIEELKDNIGFACSIVTVLILGGAVVVGIHWMLHLPEVRYNPGGECIQVIHPGRAAAGSCDRIPARHVRIVVAGGGHG